MRRAILATVLICAACSSQNGRNLHGGGGNGGSGDGGNGGSGGGGGSGGPTGPMTVDVVPPSLPPGVVGGFDGQPASTSGLTLVYPNPGAIIPHDLAQIDVQWNGMAKVYRVTFAVDTGDRLRGYVTTPDWLPDAANWKWLMDRAAGHTITLSVVGGSVDAMGNVSNVVGSG